MLLHLHHTSRTTSHIQDYCSISIADAGDVASGLTPALAVEWVVGSSLSCPLCCRYLKREYSALKPFVIISLSYLLFTTTDGAVR